MDDVDSRLHLEPFIVPGGGNGNPCCLCGDDHHMSACSLRDIEAEARFKRTMREVAPELALFMLPVDN